ncbi:MAG TPA: family 10 glycosylhydrolase, partial [Paludibacteraceae bacterium]|nr:family 10 glycosylhydrolase [Paludibacteraceae bacterium]
MRKRSVIILFLLTALTVWAQTPKQEFRAAYITTAWSIDWPYQCPVTSPGNATQIATQKAKLTTLLDRAKQCNMNAVLFQIRSFSDAMYNSAYEPWSRALTGTQGVNPGYDPLAFAITEAHKRGLELHAWINPYRVGNITPNRSPHIN